MSENPELIQGIVAVVIVICATALYAAGLLEGGAQTVEPQSLFTLYGAILGYVFGRQTGRMAEQRRATDRNGGK